MPSKPVLLARPSRANAIYLFADIRGFTSWARDYQEEIDRLLPLVYTLAVEAFGEMLCTPLLRRVVKFLGDGFFAVNEYPEDDQLALKEKLVQTITAILLFSRGFRRALRSTTLHGRKDLAMGFGVTHGTSRRFSLSNFPTDYAGHQLNLASRLCSVSPAGAIELELGLVDYLRQLVTERKLTLRQKALKTQQIKGFGEVTCLEISTAAISTSSYDARVFLDLSARYRALAKVMSRK